jgi:hypothetical protein
MATAKKSAKSAGKEPRELLSNKPVKSAAGCRVSVGPKTPLKALLKKELDSDRFIGGWRGPYFNSDGTAAFDNVSFVIPSQGPITATAHYNFGGGGGMAAVTLTIKVYDSAGTQVGDDLITTVAIIDEGGPTFNNDSYITATWSAPALTNASDLHAANLTYLWVPQAAFHG